MEMERACVSDHHHQQLARLAAGKLGRWKGCVIHLSKSILSSARWSSLTSVGERSSDDQSGYPSPAKGTGRSQSTRIQRGRFPRVRDVLHNCRRGRRSTTRRRSTARETCKATRTMLETQCHNSGPAGEKLRPEWNKTSSARSCQLSVILSGEEVCGDIAECVDAQCTAFFGQQQARQHSVQVDRVVPQLPSQVRNGDQKRAVREWTWQRKTLRTEAVDAEVVWLETKVCSHKPAHGKATTPWSVNDRMAKQTTRRNGLGRNHLSSIREWQRHRPHFLVKPAGTSRHRPWQYSARMFRSWSGPPRAWATKRDKTV